jgi:hypothetical protein
MLHVFVDDLERRKSEIEAYLAGQRIGWDGMRAIEPRMEEAFISLINRQQSAQGAL